jgi:hypothetical protein
MNRRNSIPSMRNISPPVSRRRKISSTAERPASPKSTLEKPASPTSTDTIGRPFRSTTKSGRPFGSTARNSKNTINKLLIKAVEAWVGVSNIGLIDEPKQIGYSLLPKSANNCFNSKDEDTCRSYRYCRYSNKFCMPNDNRNNLAEVGSYINSYPSGKVYKITGKISDIEIIHYGKSARTFICVLEPIKNPKSESIIIFHIGFPVLIPFFYLSSIIRMVTGEINKGKKRIVLCGHSMGGIWAQQIASYLCLNNMPVQNVFVVGSGVPAWCNYDISNFYKNRWIFFASCENGVIDQLVGTNVQRETFPMSRLAYEKNYINKIYSQYENSSEYREMGTYLLQVNKIFYPPADGRAILFNITNEKLEKSSELYSYNNSLHDFKFYRSQLYSLLDY